MKPPERTRNVFPILPLTYPVYIISMATARVSVISIPSVTSTSANAFSETYLLDIEVLPFWWVYSTFQLKKLAVLLRTHSFVWKKPMNRTIFYWETICYLSWDSLWKLHIEKLHTSRFLYWSNIVVAHWQNKTWQKRLTFR